MCRDRIPDRGRQLPAKLSAAAQNGRKDRQQDNSFANANLLLLLLC